MRRILVLGASSYIGTFFQKYIRENYGETYQVDAVSLRTEGWKSMDWSGYDSVLNVVGKAHADIGKLTKEEKREYYEVNCRLACRAAKKAIADGAGQYIYMSSIIVYGDSSDSNSNSNSDSNSNGKKSVVITKDTKPSPSNFYGDSKWKAEQKLTRLFEGKKTALAILRPPMIYGAGCKGNYVTLGKLAQKLPVFPDYQNQRSMLYIENLCEFLRLLAEHQDSGVFFPQNREYASTTELVRLIGKMHGRNIRCLRMLAPAVSVGKHVPLKIGKLVRKAFGSLVYETQMSFYENGDYQKYSLAESVKRAEKT